MNFVKFRKYCINHNNPNGRDYFSPQNFAYEAETDLGWWNKSNHNYIKNTAFEIKNQKESFSFKIFTNKLGFRVGAKEFLNNNIIKKTLIICGESNFWGQGLDHEKTISGNLEQKYNISNYNASLIACSGVQAYLIFKKFMFLKPKIFLYGMLDVNLCDNITQCANIDSPLCFERPFFKLSGNSLFIKNVKNSQRNLSRYLNWYRRKNKSWIKFYFLYLIEIIRQKIDKQRKPLSSSFDRLNNDQQKAALLGLQTLCNKFAQDGNCNLVKIVVCYLPMFSQLINDSAKKSIEEAVKNAGLIWIDLEPCLSLTGQKSINPNYFFPLDGHLNSEGHERVAAEIADKIRELL